MLPSFVGFNGYSLNAYSTIITCVTELLALLVNCRAKCVSNDTKQTCFVGAYTYRFSVSSKEIGSLEFYFAVTLNIKIFRS